MHYVPSSYHAGAIAGVVRCKPLYSAGQAHFAIGEHDPGRAGLLDEADAPVLSEVRRYNPMLFDFLLKRHLRWHGHRLGPTVFEARWVFTN